MWASQEVAFTALFLCIIHLVLVDVVGQLVSSYFCPGTKRDSKLDNRLYVNLPPHRQEEVERLLQEGGGRGWRQLGVALGYEPEQLDLVGRGEAPTHTLLSNWAQKEGSTVGLLCSALTRIERNDVASALTCPTQGVSVVWPRGHGLWCDRLWLKKQGRHSGHQRLLQREADSDTSPQHQHFYIISLWPQNITVFQGLLLWLWNKLISERTPQQGRILVTCRSPQNKQWLLKCFTSSKSDIF